MTTHVPGLQLTDHTITAPLDHSSPDGRTIEVFAREVVSVDHVGEDLPWLVFLQGGPGGSSPRPMGADGWIGEAVKTHRVLLLDQRGTGRSTPVTPRTVAGIPSGELAAYLRLFRADSIVADAELFREELAGGAKWSTLGQSYGGFITLTYLSQAPEALTACYVTGGLPGLDADAAEVYRHTVPRIAAKNAEFYARHPGDREIIRRIANHLRDNDIRFPDGDRFTIGRLRILGAHFGMSDGFDKLHWLLDTAWHGDELSDEFLYAVMAETGFIDQQFYAMQEYCYAMPGKPSRWAAQAALDARPDFAEDADPLILTGETMFPWMFQEIRSLVPFADVANELANADDWPPLYDLEVLARNTVPVAAVVYFNDMYVDADLSLDTASRVPGIRTWVTSEYEHNGIRASNGKVLAHLMDMVAGRR